MKNVYVRNMFKKVKSIIPEALASTTANTASSLSSTTYGGNFDLLIQCTTGSLYINPSTVATSANGWLMSEGDELELKVPTTLSLVSATTTAKYQGIVWEV